MIFVSYVYTNIDKVQGFGNHAFKRNGIYSLGDVVDLEGEIRLHLAHIGIANAAVVILSWRHFDERPGR